MSEISEIADVAVLGGGPAGYVAALVAAQRGARVILIEKQRVGGTCLNIGCIPTKALTTAADLLVHCRKASDFGLSVPNASLSLPALMAYKQTTVDQLVSGVEHLLRARRVAVVYGEAQLAHPGLLSVSGNEAISVIPAKHIILAPGSVAADLPVEGHDLPGVITSTEALSLDAVPARLVVVGGGVIGLEFACIYEALGSQVTVLEMTSTLLPGATDEPIAKRLQSILRRRGMAIHTGAAVQKIVRAGDALKVYAGGESLFEAEKVLIATGRWPDTSAFNHSNLGLRMSGRAIVVDDRMATNLPNVWAIGDAVGGWMLAHKAMVEGRVVAENITGGCRRAAYRSVPNVIFTRPEIASVGLTEAQARASGIAIKVSQFLLSANARGRILGETDGIARLLCEAGSGRVLGVHLLGPHVTDLIAEGALAVQLGATADDLAWTTHAHPTLPEAMLEAALGFRDAAIHMQSR
jgi:dihydrolipoamide dehydrogenase